MLLYKKNVPGGHSSCVLSQKQDCRGDNPGRNAYIRMEKRMAIIVEHDKRKHEILDKSLDIFMDFRSM